MRNFILIALLGVTLGGCATVDEWLVRPFERDDSGNLVELEESKAEELIDTYDDSATLILPVQHRWIIPTVVAAVALASTLATRVRARKIEEENELAEETDKE